jgi:hypothetical protein
MGSVLLSSVEVKLADAEISGVLLLRVGNFRSVCLWANHSCHREYIWFHTEQQLTPQIYHCKLQIASPHRTGFDPQYFFEIAGSTDPFANTSITSGLGIASTIFLITCLDYVGRRRIVCYCLSIQWICLLVIGLVGLKTNPNASLNNFLIFLACLWCKCTRRVDFSSCSLISGLLLHRSRSRLVTSRRDPNSEASSSNLWFRGRSLGPGRNPA